MIVMVFKKKCQLIEKAIVSRMEEHKNQNFDPQMLSISISAFHDLFKILDKQLSYLSGSRTYFNNFSNH
jgi:hypothetical protein